MDLAGYAKIIGVPAKQVFLVGEGANGFILPDRAALLINFPKISRHSRS